MSDDVLARLDEVLQARRTADPDGSYTARLLGEGREAILRKLGEEAIETILAGSAEDDDAVIHETADLWFHSLIMLNERGLSAAAVLSELERRFGLSGLEEKAARTE